MHSHNTKSPLRTSLMTRSALERLAGVTVVLAGLWLLVAWALEAQT